MKIKNFFEDNFNLKTFLFIMLMFILVIFAMKFYLQLNDAKEKMNNMIDSENLLMESMENLLSDYFDDTLSDLVYLDKIYHEKLVTRENYSEVIKEWEYFLEGKKNYTQFRYLDEYGQELIRLNKKNSIITNVPKNELQNKFDRYYFTEAVNLDDRGIFVTKLDLNMENKEIVEPYEPTIRASTPVYDDNGELNGVIIINYNCTEMLDNIEQNGDFENNNFYVVDEEGFYLINDDPKKCWGFMHDGEDAFRFSTDFPKEWDKINLYNYQYLTDDWLTTVAKIRINKEKILGYTISTNAEFYLISQEKFCDGFYKEDDYLSILAYTFKGIWWYLVIVTLISLFASMYYVSRKDSFREVKFFSEKDGLTGIYNRRKGMALLQKKMDYAEKNKKNFSLCFIDINGLKQVNDTFGHLCGDEIIITAVSAMKETVRDSDVLCRMGGDEFIIIFDIIGEDRAEEVWSRIVNKLDYINKNENRKYLVSLSHGIVDFNSHVFLTGDELIKLADEKMYEEKKIIKKTFNSIKKDI